MFNRQFDMFNAKIRLVYIAMLSAGIFTLQGCDNGNQGAEKKVEIKPVSKGKVVTQKEYDEIVKKKTEEMREMNSGPGGQRGGFRMGGGR